MTTRWGFWAFYPTELILLHEKEDYDIDLEGCTTSAAVLDWIAQVEGKVWATPSDVGYLVAALCDLLNPQANLCSLGEPTTIEAGEHLRELVLRNEQRTLTYRRMPRRGERSKLDRYWTGKPLSVAEPEAGA
jgi:hypothetical protein